MIKEAVFCDKCRCLLNSKTGYAFVGNVNRIDDTHPQDFYINGVIGNNIEEIKDGDNESTTVVTCALHYCKPCIVNILEITQRDLDKGSKPTKMSRENQ